MKAHEAGKGDLVQRARDKRRAREEKKVQQYRVLYQKALNNGLRLTYSTDPVKGETKLAKVIRKLEGQ